MPHVSQDARNLVPLVARVDSDIRDALNEWAVDTDRSLAAVVRVALSEGIPAKYRK